MDLTPSTPLCKTPTHGIWNPFALGVGACYPAPRTSPRLGLPACKFVSHACQPLEGELIYLY